MKPLITVSSFNTGLTGDGLFGDGVLLAGIALARCWFRLASFANDLLDVGWRPRVGESIVDGIL